MNAAYLANLRRNDMIKHVNIILFSIFSILCIGGCNTDIPVYYGAEATANTSANTQLKRLQNIQTIQFECLEHSEYQNKIPESITSKYSKDEIKQAFKNLNWEYKE